VKGVYADPGGRYVPGIRLRALASTMKRPRREGNEVRGVAYIKMDDINLAL
jgi:hypothetical protein